MSLVQRLLAGSVAALLLAACAGASSTPGPTPELPPPSSTHPMPATQSPTAATPTAAQSPTTSPSAAAATSFVPPTHATFAPNGTGTAPWDLVALGDSNVSGWGVRDDAPFSPEAAFPGVYAGRLAEEQGVTVDLHSYYPPQIGSAVRTVAGWAEVVRVDPSMRADLAAAEVVVMLIGYHDLLPALLFGRCPSTWPEMRDCVHALTDPMAAAFADLYSEVAGLVPDGATVLVPDYGIPWPVYDRWADDPDWDSIRAAVFEDWRDDLEAAAEAAGFRVIHTYAAMNEPDGRPRHPDDEITSDGWHFNATGHSLIADVVQAEDGLEAP